MCKSMRLSFKAIDFNYLTLIGIAYSSLDIYTYIHGIRLNYFVKVDCGYLRKKGENFI